MTLANEAVSLLSKFTAVVPDAFVVPEIVKRLAQTLNYNHVILTGDKCKNLKVIDPSKYRFNPKNLLSMIMDIYLNLRTKEEFAIACAMDIQSYREEVFMKTITILRRYSFKSSNDIDVLEKFFHAIEEIKLKDNEG